MEDIFSAKRCGICIENFDRSVHIPKIIPLCGHTICLLCLDGLIRSQRPCPLGCCKELPKEIESYPTNISLLLVIDEKFKEEHDVCVKHEKPKELFCVTCHHSICRACTFDHKEHKSEPLKDLKGKIDAKKRMLMSLLEDFDVQKQGISSLLKDKKKAITTSIQKRFNEIMNGLKKKERELLSHLDRVFCKDNPDFEPNLDKHEEAREQIELEICDLESGALSKRLFKTLETKVKPLDLKEESDRLSKIYETVESEFDSTTAAFQDSILSLMDDTDFSASLNTLRKSLDKLSSERVLTNAKQYLMSKPSSGNTLDIIPRFDQETQPCHLDFKAIKKATKIQVLFDRDHLQDNHFEALISLGPYFAQLTELTLIFSSDTPCTQGLVSVFSNLPFKTNTLKSLELYCQTPQISDDEFMNCIMPTLEKMHTLESLDLRLDDNRLTDKSVSAFSSQVLPKLERLTSFYFAATDPAITDTSILTLCETISEISKNLTYLGLGLNETNVSDGTIHTIAKEILPLAKKLDSLELYLSGTRISDESIACIFTESKGLPRSLRKLTLDFGRTKISDKGIAALGHRIFSAPSLEEFTLDLQHTKLTDFGVRTLLDGLDNPAKNLVALDLNFTATSVSDETIRYLGSKFLEKKMPMIRTFNLELAQVSITNESLDLLGRTIPKKIAYMTLNFEGTKITRNGVKAFLRSLEHMSKLKEFSLGLDTDQRDANTESLLEDILQRIAKK